MSYINELKEFNLAADAVKSGVSPLIINNVTQSARFDLIHGFCKLLDKNPFIIVKSLVEAKTLKDDLSFYYDENDIFIYPPKDYIFHNIETAGMSISNTRLGILEHIASGKNIVVIAPVDAVLQYTLPPKLFTQYRINLKPGSQVDFNLLKQNLSVMGYSRCESVEGTGQMCLKGGILDIFAPGYEMPLRIEFFDNEVDTVRFFNPETQITAGYADSCTIGCCRELVYTDTASIIKKLDNYKEFKWPEKDIELFKERHYFPATDRYLPLIYSKITSVTEYLTDKFILFADYPAALQEKADALKNELALLTTQFAESASLPVIKGAYTAELSAVFKNLRCPVIGINNLNTSCPVFHPKAAFSIVSRSLQSYQGRLDLVIEDIKYWQNKKYAVTVLAGSETKANALKKTLSEQNISCVSKNKFAENGEITVLPGSIHHGFEYPPISAVILGASEIFGSAKHRRRASTMPGIRLKSYADLSVGDYVVHQVHGIGKYLGMQRIEVDGIGRDYLKIGYRGSDVLYVPATSLDTVNKYVSSDGREVKVNKMGGSEFAKTKAKVKKALEDIADGLVALYAARQTQKGFAFSPDNDWQKNFEEMFPYEETPDQLRCIEEIKTDMETEKPMDRLLCGDVGFGKTEVALRAAFKAVMDSKQVAYLVPTTILAQQHYNTFVQRMREYDMINIEMLSRFRTPKQQKEIVKRINSGETDIIIGTHRILQNDLIFKDLGLLIIDEEQRFGVKHKEKIKELKTNIDVLTLSATPIPRTLHMSLTGVRDMSVIAMPPEDRHPVQTYILEYDKETVKNAVNRELARNGQVYYVYNRVEGIYKIANTLQEMAPDARIAVGHGQMSERELEDVMMRTLSGEIDILVCTTIIETGLDIPNINTIIIENADAMGLSQLYQLRGRVGRSNRLAYAYLTYRKDKVLNETAVKRLTAIREFTEFGSGFKIAMRDLEIRGAGNMLGAQQHGEMDAVGYDMYCKLLSQAVAEAKGEDVHEDVITTIDIKIDTFIPENYIEAHNIRLEIYKKIAAVSNEDDKTAMIDELIDRFGTPPQSVVNLIEIALIRVYASEAEISDVAEKNGRVHMYLAKEPSGERIKKLASMLRGQILYSGGAKPHITYIDLSDNAADMLRSIKNVLLQYNSIETGK